MAISVATRYQHQRDATQLMAADNDVEMFERSPISVLPASILMSIIGLLDNTRCRNAASLVCKTWTEAERATRVALTLRGNICHLLDIPVSFTHVSELDLTEISPWGSSILQAGNGVEEVLQRAFPRLRKLRLYAREIWDIDMMARIWPSLEEVHIVRWHERTELQTSSVVSTEIALLMRHCKSLKVVDMSDFFCWVEDIPPALESSETAQNLRVLKLQKFAPDAFTNSSLIRVVSVCHLLEELEVVCEFDPRYEDSVDDTALIAIAENCPKLRSLTMVDYAEQWRSRSNSVDAYLASEVRVTHKGLQVLLTGLAQLEELSVVSAHPVLATGHALSTLPLLCKRLRFLELGCFFHACPGPDDPGLALCTNLTSLTLRRCLDLSDDSLKAIQSRCRLLKSITISSCSSITGPGLHSLTTALAPTLDEVSISDCRSIGIIDLLQALKPLRATLRRLHLDILLADREKQQMLAARMAAPATSRMADDGDHHHHHQQQPQQPQQEMRMRMMRMMVATIHDGPSVIRRRVGDGPSSLSAAATATASSCAPQPEYLARRSQPPQYHDLSRYACVKVVEECSDINEFGGITWPKLEELSLWVELGVQLDVIFPLAFMGCERLERVVVEVEGDCSTVQGPRAGKSFGLHLMQHMPRLRCLSLDLHRLRGYTNTIPVFGPAVVQVWERHYLLGVQQLRLHSINYWPPACRESRQRGISLPAAGILSMCLHLRKVTIHGSVTEHVLNLLQRARSLRDTHFKTDYYPAPEDQNVESWLRFESALLRNKITD